ncbi:hypothetical protein GCM10027413_22390 [Conyzicola nivalis]|uniref:Uncharacterized protein n=1 Tax=Conyzicola nivalis TaxID=1477021 RepID=A0A916SBS0_9MICO|nr:DUF6804 family protein [Conyzicola nivalis]GGA92815.1 hypothetical protein GCM10010979_04230 [Conyzicola nivalis]
MSASYPTPQFRRTALAPGILGALVLLAGIALIGSDAFTIIRFAVCALALIVSVFAWQARMWWWIIGLGPIALLWNPVFPVELDDNTWLTVEYVAALVFIAAGILIKIRNPEDRNRR